MAPKELTKDPRNRAHWTDAQWDPEWDPTPYLQGDRTGHGRQIIFDIEGDGLLFKQGNKKEGSELWCIGAIDVNTEEKFYWGIDLGVDSLLDGLEFISQCDRAMAHHGLQFDYPYLERWLRRFYGREWKRPRQSWDTEVIAKVVWPYDALIGPDLKRIRAGRMPANLMKSHSLKAWGYRTGTHKVEYAGGFDEWCPAMATYLMTGDLDGPLALWRLVEKRVGWRDPEPGALIWPELTFEVENEVQEIIFRQQCDGVTFDFEAAVQLAGELRNEQARLERELKEAFGEWWEPLDDPEEGTAFASTTNRKLTEFPDITVRRFSEKTGKELKPYVGPPLAECTEGARHVRIERVAFNPSSRDHLGKRLQAVYGWKPKKFGKDGKPTVDETVLSEIPEAVIPSTLRQTILDYFVVSKTLGTLSKGRKAWLNLYNEETGCIHGEMDTCGAITRRGTHKNPNLSGTPSVKKEKVKQPDGTTVELPVRGLKGRYGWECRALFTADREHLTEQTGVDCSALELIDLGHYLEPLDGGAFRDRVCDPSRDPHTEHAELAGMTRADAKTATYLYVYGGSAYKLSLDISISPEEVVPNLAYRGLPMLLKNLEKRFDADFVAKMDDAQKAKLAKARQIILKFESGITGIKELKEKVSEAAARGWLKAMDGSRIHVRKQHAALNALLQSAGAITCKLWMMLTHRKLAERGLVWGKDYRQTLWVHDELQFVHRPGLGPVIAEVCEEAVQEAGRILKLRGTYRTDAKTGRNWAECH